jgi:hypothetical protein
VSGTDSDWRAALAAAVGRAPDELRALASDQLHIGGFTNVRLDHPVLDLRAVEDDALAARALAFFTAAALLRGATAARVHVRREDAGTLPRRAKRELRGIVRRVDDENAALMRYFDLHLRAPAEVRADAGRRLARRVAEALADTAPGAP